MTVHSGNCGVGQRRAVAGGEQSGSAARERDGELRALLYPEASARESFGVIGKQQMFPIGRIDALGAKACRHYRHAMGKGLQNLDPRTTAGAHGNNRDIGRRVKRRQVLDEAMKPHLRVPGKVRQVCRTAGPHQVDADLSIGQPA